MAKCFNLGINMYYSSVYRPRCNGKEKLQTACSSKKLIKNKSNGLSNKQQRPPPEKNQFAQAYLVEVVLPIELN